VRYIYIVIFIPLLLLVGSNFWFSLHTPFGLIDDYTDWYELRDWATWPPFLEYLKDAFSFSSPLDRFRPLYDIGKYSVWALYGDNPAVHHANRWGMKILGAVFSVFALRKILPIKTVGICSVLFLVMYFVSPNNPEARLAPQEMGQIFWLLFSNFLFVTLLFKEEDLSIKKSSIYLWMLFLSLFAFACAKETSVATVPIFAFYLFLAQRKKWFTFVMLLPFYIGAILYFFKILFVIRNPGYGHPTMDTGVFEFLHYRLSWIKLECASFIPNRVMRGFLYFIPFLAFGTIVREKIFQKGRYSKNRKLYYMYSFVLLQFLSQVAICALSWLPVHRYAALPVLLFTILYVISVSILLDALKEKRVWHNRMKILMACFSFCFIYFCAYNNSKQFLLQYNARNIERDLLNYVESISNNDTLIVVKADAGEYEHKLFVYFNEYSPARRGLHFHVAKEILPEWKGKVVWVRRDRAASQNGDTEIFGGFKYGAGFYKLILRISEIFSTPNCNDAIDGGVSAFAYETWAVTTLASSQ
jgi:hypothetical protein